jgi:hypothetical protein
MIAALDAARSQGETRRRLEVARAELRNIDRQRLARERAPTLGLIEENAPSAIREVRPARSRPLKRQLSDAFMFVVVSVGLLWVFWHWREVFTFFE